MAGPLPLPIEHGASSYGEETDIKRNIAAAAQYNPATKLGITTGDQPSKKATATIPTSVQTLGTPAATPQVPLVQPVVAPVPHVQTKSPASILPSPPEVTRVPGPRVGFGNNGRKGFGPDSGLTPSALPTQPFLSGSLESDLAQLRSLPDTSPEIRRAVNL